MQAGDGYSLAMGREVRDGTSMRRKVWNGNAFSFMGEMHGKNSLDAAWHGTKRRDPSTQPHSLAVVRLSVGMTRVNIVNIYEIFVDIKRMYWYKYDHGR